MFVPANSIIQTFFRLLTLSGTRYYSLINIGHSYIAIRWIQISLEAECKIESIKLRLVMLIFSGEANERHFTYIWIQSKEGAVKFEPCIYRDDNDKYKGYGRPKHCLVLIFAVPCQRDGLPKLIDGLEGLSRLSPAGSPLCQLVTSDGLLLLRSFHGALGSEVEIDSV